MTKIPSAGAEIAATCHCGAVTLHIAAAPTQVTDCNCSICRRYGVLWAYYPPCQVRVTGAPTDIYMWNGRTIQFHRCPHCGCVTHWSPLDPARNRMGVNARLMEFGILDGARVRKLDGAVTEDYVDEQQ